MTGDASTQNRSGQGDRCFDGVEADLAIGQICGVLEIDQSRLWNLTRRRDEGTLADRTPGGKPIHWIVDCEEQAIIAVLNERGSIDLSYRKLAHLGS